MAIPKVDRVISTSQGEINLTTPPQVYQALDQSIIKSLDVHEGMKVSKGQVLATLNSTFAVADARQLKQQVASLNAQILRDDAELAGQAPVFPTATTWTSAITTNCSTCSSRPPGPVPGAAQEFRRADPADRGGDRQNQERYLALCRAFGHRSQGGKHAGPAARQRRRFAAQPVGVERPERRNAAHGRKPPEQPERNPRRSWRRFTPTATPSCSNGARPSARIW